MLLVLLAAQASSPACLADGASGVTVSGTIHLATAKGDPAGGEPAYRYVTLALDKPICVHGGDGTISAARTVELVEHAPNLTLPFRFKGRHVSVTASRVTLDAKAPLPVMLEDPTIQPS